jgi:6-pyruvoyltetrahydropterin/6-carboxytetrahydropterin synthase
MTHKITRKFEFDAGHRVLRHESKCANLHGHRYVAELTVVSSSLDDVGRVVDFSVIKDVVGGWIDHFWDHNLILHPDDPLVVETAPQEKTKIFGPKSPYVMPNDWNPTAENMVRVLFRAAEVSLAASPSLKVAHVRLYETPNCWADCGEGIQ